MNFVFALVMEVCILNIIIYFKNECCIMCVWAHAQGRKGGGGGWLWWEELGCERSFMIVISIFSNRTLCNHYFEQRNF